MPALLDRIVAARGAERALVVDTHTTLTWDSLAGRVNRWGRLLREHGLGPGDQISCVTGNRAESFELVLACLHTGITLVPVNWHLTAPEIAHILADSGSRAVIVQPSSLAAVASAVASAPDCKLRIVLGATAASGFAAADELLATVDGGELPEQTCGATMLYTSGTTGAPKGVVNNLFTVGAPFARVDKLMRYAHSVLRVPAGERVLLDGPWYHSSQLFFALLSLLQGSTLVIRSQFDPAETLAAIDREQITAVHLVPTQLVRLLRVPDRAGFSGASLRTVWHGGGACPIPVKRDMVAWWGPVLTEYYGATEGGAVTLIDAEAWLERPGSVGRALPGCELVVVDAEGRPVPAGVRGRVYVRRLHGSRFKYHNAPEKTRGAYLGDDTFTFGEVGFLDDDGYLFLTGRAQELIVSGGVNVYPAEVEAVLLSHPAVHDAAVIGVPDHEFGERVAAVIVLRDLADAERVLDAHCRRSLAGFKVPRLYSFVPDLQREPTGKLRKHLLTAHFERPDVAHPATYAAGVPHAEFARRRRESPVTWVDEPLLTRHSAAGLITHRGSGYWAVTSHEAVLAASRRTDDFSSARKGAFLVDPRTPGDLRQTRQLLISMDEPEHLRIRRLVTSVFTPRAVKQLADSITAHAERLARSITAMGEFDIVTDLARELPLLVLCDLLGVPEHDRHLLYSWSNHLVGFDDPEYGGGDIDVYRRTFAEAFTYALHLASARREHPTEDLISRLANAELDGRRLTDREFCNFWLLLVVAGNETTRHLITGSLQALTEYPDERHRLVSGEVPMSTAVDELLRWVTPIMQFRRTATRDTELSGRPIKAGDKVVLYYTAANRDEQVFADPDRLNLGRDPNPHLAFGTGPHFCLGSHLAKLEMTSLLTALLPHLDRLELTGPAVRMESNFVNAVKSQPARCKP
ncbi:cytochrome P450 [Dactylosporangium sp. CS-033363]|uniref:cytochrome P450 n=1 Tax=Dactylosporangium sp. CS-033363 TaxID=3239935 RepID=UPI003D9050F9